jgi:predicted GNAT family acetyltransferase
MIKKLEEKDRSIVLDFLSEEPSINLFAIGDIEIFGFEEDFQDIWGQFNGTHLEGVLLRYNQNFIPYWKKESFNPQEFIKIIKTSSIKNRMISGKKSIIKYFEDIFNNYNKKETYFCELKKAENLVEDASEVKTAQVSDKYRIPQFTNTIEEFRDSPDVTPEQFEKKIKTNSGRAYYIENDKGKIISVAQSTAENSQSAMIVGVATRPGYRRKGLVSKCMSKLCKDYLNEGKTLCLFYDNPEAGNIYKKIGFKEIDKWTMIYEK